MALSNAAGEAADMPISPIMPPELAAAVGGPSSDGADDELLRCALGSRPGPALVGTLHRGYDPCFAVIDLAGGEARFHHVHDDVIGELPEVVRLPG
jgi:hypothetical protein